MKIAIFENEYDTVEVAFEYANKKYFKKQITFYNYSRSQDFNELKKLSEYFLTIVDIDLSSQSTLDGFGLIRKIETNFSSKQNILIMTGQALSNNYHLDNSLKYKYEILEKSINFKKIKEVFDKLGVSPALRDVP